MSAVPWQRADVAPPEGGGVIRTFALAVLLCVGTATAQTSTDAPVVIEVQRANILSKSGDWTYPEGGLYLNQAATENTAAHVRALEANRITDGQLAAAITGALVLGFLGGVAAAKLLPQK